MKKSIILLSSFLVISLVSCNFGVDKLNVFQAINAKNGFNYSLDNNNQGYILETVDKENIWEETLIIPENVGEEGLPVVGIGYKALFNFKYIKELHLPSTIKSIDSLALYLCSNLSTIHFGGTVEQWGKIEKSSSWDDSTGDYKIICSDGSVITKEGELYDPEEDDEPEVDNVKGVYSYEYVKSSDSYVITGLSDKEVNLILPSSYNNKIVSGISASAFQGNSTIKSIVIPETVNNIPEKAFYGCSKLQSVIFNGNINEIGTYAFVGCQELKAVSFNGSVDKIGDYAFQSCKNIASLVFRGKVDTIGRYAFSLCGGLASVEFYDTVSVLDQLCFEKCINLKSIKLHKPCSVWVSDGAFFYCEKLDDSASPSFFYDMEYIGEFAFYGCTSLTFTPNFTHPEDPKGRYVYFKNLLFIGSQAFAYAPVDDVAYIAPRLCNVQYLSFGKKVTMFTNPYLVYALIVSNSGYYDYFDLGLALDMDTHDEHIISLEKADYDNDIYNWDKLPFPFFSYKLGNITQDNVYDYFFEFFKGRKKSKKYVPATFRDRITFTIDLKTLGKNVQIEWKCPWYKKIGEKDQQKGEVKVSWKCSCGKETNYIQYKEVKKKEIFEVTKRYDHCCK